MPKLLSMPGGKQVSWASVSAAGHINDQSYTISLIKNNSWTYSSRISSLFYNHKITIPKFFLKLHPLSLFYCMDMSFLHLPDTGALFSAYSWVFCAKECFEIQKFEISLRICFFSLHFIELDCLVFYSENDWLSFSQASAVHFWRVGRSLALAFFHHRIPEFLQERTRSVNNENCSVLSGVLMEGSILALCL